MYELFKTVLIMSCFGFCVTALLLLLKPITAKRFSAKWQYSVWMAVLICMLAPTWKLIPQQAAREFIKTPVKEVTQTVLEETQNETAAVNDGITINHEETIPIEQREIPLLKENESVKFVDLISYIWLCGVAVFLLIVLTSYLIYLHRKRKNAVLISDNAVLSEVKSELNIKRNVKVRMSPDIKTPLLCGAVFPVIYIPCKNIPEKNLRMVFLHEITHYKRKDILIKWFALFVNAIHWFNPLAYLLTVNVGESCEISCDKKVTKNMEEAEQKLYMKTILDLL